MCTAKTQIILIQRSVHVSIRYSTKYEMPLMKKKISEKETGHQFVEEFDFHGHVSINSGVKCLFIVAL